jgi:primosomal protein N' (replication factor Y)
MQRNLFPTEPAAPETLVTGLFAEIVFDRPFDQPFTYAVPETLQPHVAVGKRVRVPLGRGDKPSS